MDTDSLNSFLSVSGNSEILLIMKYNVAKVHLQTWISALKVICILFVIPDRRGSRISVRSDTLSFGKILDNNLAIHIVKKKT